MTVECIIFIVGVIVQIASEHAWAQFAVGRLISGLGVGALSAAVPMVSFPHFSSTVANLMLILWFAVPSRDCASPNPWYPHSHLPTLHYIRYSRRLLYLHRYATRLRICLMANCRRHWHSLGAHPWYRHLVHARISSVSRALYGNRHVVLTFHVVG